MRHSVGKPFEIYFPNIDYEWEYIMVADGGISARGLHDGAPNYEIFYEHPHTDTRVRTCTFRYTTFLDLHPPMEQIGRSWCFPAPDEGGVCPGFGTPRWV